MKKKYLSISLMFFVSMFLFSQELILKVKNHANIVGWLYQKENLENSYCLYDDNYFVFASSTNQQKPIIHIYKELESQIIYASFYISNTRFVALDNDNTVLEARFDDLEKSSLRKVHEKLIAKSIAISPNDEMEVSGFENGFLQIHYLLKHTKKNVDVYFKAHDDSIYSINFSSMGQYFITSGKDEKTKIWDARNLVCLNEFPSYAENYFPAVFSPLNDSFIYCTSKQILCISDIEGKLKKEIAVVDGIRLAKFTEKKDRIAVLTEAKKLEFYDATTGQYEGAIHSLENVCSFDINFVTGTILIGTEEGEVYIASNKEIRLSKGNVRQIKKVQINKKETSEESKTPALSNKILKYLGLEEDEDIQEPDLRKPFSPLKYEKALEDPVTFTKKTETIKKAPNKTSVKTLNEAVLDDDELKFQENPEDKSTKASPDKVEKEESDTSSEEEETQSDDETQEDGTT